MDERTSQQKATNVAEQKSQRDETRFSARDASPFKGAVKNKKRKIVAPEKSTLPVCVTKDEEYYQMNHKPRGLALIFNQQHFQGWFFFLSERKGSDCDRDRLKKVLESLHFEVRVYNDCKKMEMDEVLAKVAEEDHTKADCIIIVVMSHGRKGYVWASDGMYDLKKLYKHFTPDNCPTLVGKPKIFFVQACKGTKTDDGVKVMHQEGSEEMTYTDSSSLEKQYSIPKEADFLIVYATVPGYISWRSEDKGSWFIQSLCDVLEQNGTTHDLVTLMTSVSRRVAYFYESRCTDEEFHAKKQLPCIVSKLTRLVLFSEIQTKDSIKSS